MARCVRAILSCLRVNHECHLHKPVDQRKHGFTVCAGPCLRQGKKLEQTEFSLQHHRTAPAFFRYRILFAFFDIQRLRESFASSDATQTVEYRRLFPDGKVRWASCRVDMTENPETGDKMLFAYVRDNHTEKVDELASSKVVKGLIDFISCVDVETGTTRFVQNPKTAGNLPLMELGKAFGLAQTVDTVSPFLPDEEERAEFCRLYTIPALTEALEQAPMSRKIRKDT